MASSSESSNDELDTEVEEELIVVAAISRALLSTSDYFQDTELDEKIFVDQSIGVIDQLTHIIRMPSLFRVLTNFTILEWEELWRFVCPVIAAHARNTGQAKGVGGRPCKLDPPQRLLNSILFLKHDNTCVFDGSHWNWSKSSVCDDAIFVASCINSAISDEIKWPNSNARQILGQKVPNFPRCIGLIDGTLCKIRRPWNDPLHKRWFNGRKKMYCVNNIVIVDHDGLFIYIDPGYYGSSHDVTMLRGSTLFVEWRSYFAHSDQYFEYLLGDPGYIGEEQFIMRRMGQREIVDLARQPVIDAFNKVHAGIRVQVEWGIGGMKCKWKRMMSQFDMTKDKFTIFFRTACLLTNFIHRRRRDMTIT